MKQDAVLQPIGPDPSAHLDDHALVDLCGGLVPDDRRRAWLNHVAACELCERRLRDATRLASVPMPVGRQSVIGRGVVRRVLLGTAAIVVLGAIALAGPSWTRVEQPVFRSERATVVVLDLSRSMDASDIKPSRLARARFKIADLLERNRDGLTGLVVYAGDAFVVAPLTDDSVAVTMCFSCTVVPVPSDPSLTP